ncbi:RNA-binding protein Musashi [Paragonimus westermani]|uniref:RNA-binding protein Musashi n=1 Tax=Paragonimus westermani TaxID=34504 RepID=A0A5J4P2T9_9TREM|nr:RNA-binding protein Musashi [Paragonimus westermani]
MLEMTVSRPKPSSSPSDDSAVSDMNSNGTSTIGSSNGEVVCSDSAAAAGECLSETYTKLSLTKRQSSNGLENGADSNDPGKMFIGGLSPTTTSEKLRDYFKKYGEIKEFMIMRDPLTKRSRGFGFVTFSDPLCVEKVLEDAPHMLDSKKIDPKLAVPRKPGQNVKLPTRTKRVFIGGVATQTTNEELSEYFSHYGKVEAKKAVPKEVMSSTNSLLKQRHQFLRPQLRKFFIPLSLVDSNLDLASQLACLTTNERDNAPFLSAPLNGAAAAAAATYTLTATSPVTARQPSAYAYLPGYYLSPGECPLSQPLPVFVPSTALLPPFPNMISMS